MDYEKWVQYLFWEQQDGRTVGRFEEERVESLEPQSVPFRKGAFAFQFFLLNETGTRSYQDPKYFYGSKDDLWDAWEAKRVFPQHARAITKWLEKTSTVIRLENGFFQPFYEKTCCLIECPELQLQPLS